MGSTIHQKIFGKVLSSQEEPLKIPKEDKVIEFESKGKHYIFLPAYIEVETKQFSFLSVKRETVDFCGKVRIKLPHYPPEIAKDLQKNLHIKIDDRKIFLNLQREGAKCKIDDQRAISWTLEFYKKIAWTPYLRFLPFDKQYLPICVELSLIKPGKNRYYFNILNLDDEKKKEFILPSQVRVHRLEDFALYYYQPRYESIRSYIGRRKVEYFPRITLYFTLVRSPWNYFLTVLLPNFILQLLSILLFFTENDFEERVGNIITLMVAIVVFLPIVRDGLPHIPYLTLMDFLIYSSVVNLGLFMLEAFLTRDSTNNESDSWFIAACCLVFITSAVIGVCMLYRIGQYFWVLKKTLERKNLIEKKNLAEMEQRDLETAVVAIGPACKNDHLHPAENESRQSQEAAQNVAIEPREGHLSPLKKHYAKCEIELMERTREGLKPIRRIPEEELIQL